MHVGMPIQHDVFSNFYLSNNLRGKQMAVCNRDTKLALLHSEWPKLSMNGTKMQSLTHLSTKF